MTAQGVVERLGFDRCGHPNCDVARHRRHLEPLTRLWSGLADTAGLVIDGWVEHQLADELAGGGVDDANVEAVDQHQDGDSGVSSADPDVVQPAVVAEGEFGLTGWVRRSTIDLSRIACLSGFAT